MGAEILFYPTAIGWATSQNEATNTEQYNAWQTIQRSHSVANGVPVVSVNRVGFEQNGAMKFWGGSFITNAFGAIEYLASHDKEEVHVEKIDLEQADRYRTHRPFPRDRRIDSYQFPITKRFIDEDEPIPHVHDTSIRRSGRTFSIEDTERARVLFSCRVYKAHCYMAFSWPHKEASWPGKIATIFPVYAQFIKLVAEGEKVNVNVADEAMSNT